MGTIHTPGITALLLIAAAMTDPAVAAQMYRCGNIYQDQPCAAGQQSKTVRPLGAGATAGNNAAPAGPGNPATDATCPQRGADSQKIVWSREGGLTLEAQLASETDPQKKKLIADVYRVRGTAPQVRSRIEAECRVEMEERAKMLELQKAMSRAGVLPQQTPGAAAASAAGQKAAAEAQARNEAQRAADAKTSRCNQINARGDAIQDDLRKGGSTAVMENLNRQMRALQQERQSSGCT